MEDAAAALPELKVPLADFVRRFAWLTRCLDSQAPVGQEVEGSVPGPAGERLGAEKSKRAQPRRSGRCA